MWYKYCVGQSLVLKEIREKEYEILCKGRAIPLTQNYFYGEWQKAIGKKVWRYSMTNNGHVFGFFQVVKNSLLFGVSYMYIPHGPVVLGDIPVGLELSTEFGNFCLELCKKEDSVFLRFDPLYSPWSKVQPLAWGSSGVAKSLYDGNFQPKYEWVLDLMRGEDDILAGMKKVNRYTIRQAEKRGVEIEIIDKNFGQHLDKFYELEKMTALRDAFAPNLREYYSAIFNECEMSRNAFMAIGRFNGEIVLINFHVMYGDTVFFLLSASEDSHREVGYTYFAQWETMKYAKKIGIKQYNFGAVIPDNNKYSFYKRWRGFSDFKKRFGGFMLEYSDFHDVIYSRFWYTLYCVRKIIGLFIF